MIIAKGSATHTSTLSVVPKSISESTAMKQKRHFENADLTAVRDTATIGAMIADMQRVVQVLDSDVSTEEELSRIRDRSDARYPIIARQLAARRDNLKVTIAALEARLSSIRPSLPAGFAAA